MSAKTRLKCFAVGLALPFLLIVGLVLGLIFGTSFYDKVSSLWQRMLMWATGSWKEEGEKDGDIL